MSESEHFMEMDTPISELRVHAADDMTANAIQLQCPACKTWCNSEVHAEELILGAELGQNVVSIHMNVTLHVHDHDCPVARDQGFWAER